jgi:hypothetical protein
MKSRRLLLITVPALGLGLQLSSARAAEPTPECPPGEWFCDEVTEPGTPPAPAGSEPARSDSTSEELDGSEWDPRSSESDGDDAEPRSFDVRRRRPSVRDADESAGLQRDWASPWSVNLRIEGALLGRTRGRGADAGLGGVGASLRYALNPIITLDLGLDSMLGTDYNGYERNEYTLSLSSLFYFNPEQLIRTYVIAGLNSTAARVDVDGDGQSWGYFGGHAGLGLDFAVDRRVALTVDLLAFIRGRTDDRAAREPEFVDSFGRVSNTSGGGLFRGGLSLFW